MLVGKGSVPEANRATPAIRGNKVEMGTCHDGLCDSLSTDGMEAQCSMGDNEPTH